jgi:hypothetical protein
MTFSGRAGFAQKAFPVRGNPVPSMSARACSL